MCTFLSAIVLRNGDIICDPEHTDSHEDLIEANELRDNGRGFVRVEFTPNDPNTTDDVSTWSLRLDDDVVPDWWSDSVSDAVRKYLSDLVSGHIVRTSRRILVGGWWIIAKDVTIGKAVGTKIVYNFGTVTNNYGTVTNNSGTVTNNCNSGTVTNNCNYGTVTNNYGTVTDNFGTVTNNYGTVTNNSGTVTNNCNYGTVTNNYGTVTDNFGTVTNDD